MAYKIDEELFSYNKDSDEWFCSEGNITVNKKHRKDKSGKQKYKYYFEKEKCRNCAKRNECNPRTQIARVLEVGINTPEFYGYSQEQRSEEFKEKYKNRACQEWKNGEFSWIRLCPWVWFKKHRYTSKIDCISNKLKEDSSYTTLQNER